MRTRHAPVVHRRRGRGQRGVRRAAVRQRDQSRVDRHRPPRRRHRAADGRPGGLRRRGACTTRRSAAGSAGGGPWAEERSGTGTSPRPICTRRASRSSRGSSAARSGLRSRSTGSTTTDVPHDILLGGIAPDASEARDQGGHRSRRSVARGPHHATGREVRRRQQAEHRQPPCRRRRRDPARAAAPRPRRPRARRRRCGRGRVPLQAGPVRGLPGPRPHVLLAVRVAHHPARRAPPCPLA